MKTAFFDVDTQLDFVYPAGALYTPGAEGIVKQLKELTRFADANGITLISTADAHSENDPEFREWKPHCVIGTTGQQKVAATLLKDPVVLTTAPDRLTGVEADVASTSQIIVQKQKIDCFTNPNLKPLLNLLKADRFVVYGVLTEFCVRAAMFGLLEMGFRVEAVTDAINSFDPERGSSFIRQFQAGGGKLTTVKQVTG
ncbi:MAG TPA: isochorismatase family cysteine hydrolase [Bryobacteraceae bacterium]|nr:isochorismatase family cysteine hydrolase [Bryobacteraceae bacterium]